MEGMTIPEIEKRIKELEEELAKFGDSVSDAYSMVQGVDNRRMELENELQLLKEELERLKKA